MMSKPDVGLQLYTLRDLLKDDFLGTLKKVAEIGYKHVEFAGYGGISAAEMRKALDDLGLKSHSSHTNIQALRDDFNKNTEYFLEIGNRYIAFGSLSGSELGDPERMPALMEEVERLGERCKQIGLQLCYHNHAFEFDKVGENVILEEIYNRTSPEHFQAELDLYWVKKAGFDPLTLVQTYKGRVPLLHIKDMADDEAQSFAEVGHGIIDYHPVFEAATELGVRHYIVEQDKCQRPPLESVKMSFDYLRSIGIA